MLDFQNRGAGFKRALMGDVQEYVARMLSTISATVAAQKDGAVISDQHRVLNFQGPGVQVSDDSARRRANIFISGTAQASSSSPFFVSAVGAETTLYRLATDTDPAGWQNVGFNDAAWTASTTVTAYFTPPSGAVWISTTPGATADDARMLVRRAFTLPNGTITAATLTYGADNYTNPGVWLNGTLINSTTNDQSLITVTPSLSLLTPAGTNVLAFRLSNTPWPPPNLLRLAYRLDVTVSTGGANAPGVATFTWVNQGSATAVDQSGGGIYFSVPGTASQDVKALVKTAPPTPYTITAGFVLHGVAANFAGAGLVLRDSASGKLIIYELRSNNGPELAILQYTNPTTFSANALLSASGLYAMWGPLGMIQLQITDDGTNRLYQFSRDGSHWVTLLSEARTTFLTANQVGAHVTSGGSSQPTAMSLMQWNGA